MSERRQNLSNTASKESIANKQKLIVKSTRNQPKFQEGEKILCYHGAFIYEAKCLKVERSNSNEYKYFVHYNGWNKNWDEWVPFQRILKYNEENLKKQQELLVASRSAKTQNITTIAKSNSTLKKDENLQETKKESNRNAINSNNSTNQFSNNNDSNNNSKKRKLTTNSVSSNPSICTNSPSSHASPNPASLSSNETYDSFEPITKKICVVDIHSKNINILTNPKFKLNFPESLKEWLIDDFDFVIQQNKILRLPARKNVTCILKEYLKMKQSEDESTKNIVYSSRLNETVNGLIRYFNSMLGSQLLYKFERVQYIDILKMRKQVSDIYGAIHLLRLFERLNQMILYVPLDEQSLEALIYYVNDILKHLDKDNKILFESNDYILAPPFYVRASI